MVARIYVAVAPHDRKANAEYQRFKQEVLDSQIFDRLKLELGLKNFNRLVKQKLMPIPLDLTKRNLNLSVKLWDEIKQNLNVIINSAATVDLQVRLDQAVRVNVTGPLQLMDLASQSPHFETFLQLSTCYVNCDRQGYVEETLYSKQSVDWAQEYDQVKIMNEF